MRIRSFALLLTLLLWANAWAEDRAKKNAEAEEMPVSEPAVQVDPEMIRLFLMDGSVITGKLSVKSIEIETQFGPLTVPITEVRSFTPGLGSHPDLGKKVYDLIDSLGSNDFDERELAQKELQKMGPPVRAELEKRAADPDTERRMRIKNIIDEFDNQKDDDEEEVAPAATTTPLIPRDMVETSEFTVVGKLATKSFTISSLYGPLTVKLADIRRGQREGNKRPDLRASVTVDGTNIVQRSFKTTTIRVDRGDKVTVTADGTMGMTPWGNGMFSTPDGGANFGWYVPNSIPGGALVAAVGNDEVFKVGSKSSFRASRTGLLKFAIGMQGDYANQNFPGKYTVKVRVERK